MHNASIVQSIAQAVWIQAAIARNAFLGTILERISKLVFCIAI